MDDDEDSPAAQQREHERAKTFMQRQGRSLAFCTDPSVLLEVLEEAIQRFGNEATIDDITQLLSERGI